MAHLENPTLILENRNFDNYGNIINYTDFHYKDNFNSPNEISFTIHKLKDNKSKNILWDKIKDLKVLYIPDYDERFEISVSDDINNTTTKSVTGLALAESELSQILLRNIEINTDIDFENSLYDANFPTVFCRDIEKVDAYNDIWESDEKYTVYNDDIVDAVATLELRKDILRHSSLLHRITEKASNYTISHVDKTLLDCNWIRSFSINSEYIYDVLTGDIASEFGVLFQFDSNNRTISAYDLYNTCEDCGHRGDYENICPKCGSTNIYGQYGEDTTVFVSSDALASQLSKTGNPSGVKTCFYIEAGDDLMTAAVAALNPSGSSYIYNFSQDMLDEMPEDMVARIKDYQSDYDYYMNEKEYTLTQEYVDDYNEIVTWLKTYYDQTEYPTITNPLVGYTETAELYYNLIDIESVLQTSLLPTITIQNPTIEESLDLIGDMLKYETSGVIAEGTIAVSNPESCMPPSPAPDNAVLNMVKATINTSLYKPEIVESTYGMYEGLYKWIGTIRLTSLEVGEGEIPETGSREYTFTVSGDVDTYLKQQIKKNMARVDITEILDLTSLDEKTSTDEWMEWFTEELHYYSADALEQLQTEFRTCQQVIMDLQEKLDKESSLDTIFGDPSKHYYDIYTERLELIDAELEKRNSDIGKLYRLYEYNYQTNFANGEIIRLRTEVNNALNFQKYMEGTEGEVNYWSTFCGYIREDTYTNENYISDGLNNTEIMERAKELLEAAQQEILKSSNNQYTINTTLNNLLAIPKFTPLVNHFKVGNWIRIEFEDEIYKLRLLSYQINYDNLTNLDVEFSTVIYSSITSSDIRSILDSARKISGSYNSVVKQMNKTTDTANNTAENVDDGIDSTNIPITNDSLTQDIKIDKNGILGRAYDDIEDKYDDCQFLFVHNRLVMTNDNWKSIYTSLGKFTYEDEGEEKTAYGLLADTIVGNFILGKQLSIKNDNGTLSFDNDGLHVENTEKTVCVEIDPNAENVFQISTGYDENTEKYTKNIMYVDSNGNGHFDGEIESESGTIGGWQINSDNISKSTNYSVQEGNTYRNGASSLVLSSSGSSDYALKASYNYQEQYSGSSLITNKENIVEISNDGHLYIREKAQSSEGGTNFGTTELLGGAIKLNGINAASMIPYETTIDSTGIHLEYQSNFVISLEASSGEIECKGLVVNGTRFEEHTHQDILQLIQELREQVEQLENSVSQL